jgi:hypothetical protein
MASHITTLSFRMFQKYLNDFTANLIVNNMSITFNVMFEDNVVSGAKYVIYFSMNITPVSMQKTKFKVVKLLSN